MEQENKKKVEEQPIVEEKEKTTSFASKAKKVGKWVGIVIAGLGIGATGYYFGRKSATTSTTVTETETETI